ncbi:hypothetical protein [Pararobbsia alpina]|uniref:hypothetical protein n=1 Tax=Pararobbsia alpina TaxID=621374 RepID=UPI0015814DBD|nr:hypothetical protein [Pararobbsia alpina]
MRDKQVAHYITQVLNSLAAHSGIGKPLEEKEGHAFSAEICALQRALALLGVTSEHG